MSDGNQLNQCQELIRNITGLTNKEINSIELNKTAKGDYSWSIKIYFEPKEEIKTLELIKAINDKLKLTYGGL